MLAEEEERLTCQLPSADASARAALEGSLETVRAQVVSLHQMIAASFQLEGGAGPVPDASVSGAPSSPTCYGQSFSESVDGGYESFEDTARRPTCFSPPSRGSVFGDEPYESYEATERRLSSSAPGRQCVL